MKRLRSRRLALSALGLWLAVAGCATACRDPAPPAPAPSTEAGGGATDGVSPEVASPGASPSDRSPAGESTSEGAPSAATAERVRMVREQIEARGVDDPAVLAAMRRVPRDRFLPPERSNLAHGDFPVEIGHGQTISQPYIVAIMSELARIAPGERVLEIGTGSGYQAAILAEMGARVWTIEIVEPLAKSSAALLRELGYDDVTVRHGDGYAGWPEEAPFDAILLTAAPPKIPEPLLDQLAPGGRLVAPVGRWAQKLVVATRGEDGLEWESVLGVRFVPMTGEAQQAR